MLLLDVMYLYISSWQILPLYGRTQFGENPYSRIFYREKDRFPQEEVIESQTIAVVRIQVE